MATNHKGCDDSLLSEEIDTKHDQPQETLVEDEALAPAPSGDDNDSWHASEEVSDADYEEAKMAMEADEVGMSSWGVVEVVVEGVVPTPIQQLLLFDLTHDADNPFIDAYNRSIKKARDMITGQ